MNVTWTVIDYSAGLRIVAQGLTREFAKRVVAHPRHGGAYAMHEVQEIGVRG